MSPRGDARQPGDRFDAFPAPGVFYGLARSLSSFAAPESTPPRQIEYAATRARRESDLGDALHRQGRTREATERFAAALALQPNQAEFHYRFACSAWASGKLDLVERHLREAARLDPRKGCVAQALAMWQLHLRNADEAIRAAQFALSLEPAGEDAIITYADVLHTVGRSNEAYSALMPLIERGSLSAFFGRTLAKVAMNAGHEDQAIDIGRRILAAGIATPYDRCQLSSALCPLLERSQRYDEAFAQARLAKETARPPYDSTVMTRNVTTAIGYFSRQRLNVLPRASRDTRRPVFIVGMPRSGTSLVEQILASHPYIFGAGELTTLPDLLQSRAMRPWAEGTSFPGCFDYLSMAKANELTDEYLKTLNNLNASARHVTDKMPQNFLYLGAIQILFPQARVIHCVRDPRDVCLSCYMTPFISGHEYTHDKSHLAHYYREYVRLMAHWKATLDLPILEVAYEELVENQEPQTRRMIAFLDLPWDERCMNFQDTIRPVATASRDQVRQPIYRSSVQRWKHYEKHIPEFLALVDPQSAPETKTDPSTAEASGSASGQTATA